MSTLHLQFVKDLHISFISSTESVMNELMSVLSHYWRKILLVFEPTFIEIIHHIDSTFWASTRKLVGKHLRIRILSIQFPSGVFNFHDLIFHFFF